MGTRGLTLELLASRTLPDVREPIGRDGLAEAREVIEQAIVRLAALRRTESDLERLRDLLAGMRECRDEPEAFSELDFALHVALSDAARNPLVAGTLSSPHELVRENEETDEAARISSDMMALLRIEADRGRERALSD